MSSQTRTAIVTGASGGIGSAIAAMLHDEGFELTLVGRDPAKLAAVASSLTTGPPVHTLAGSLAEETFLDTIVDEHAARHGALDVLVNNAGVSGNRAVGEITAEFLDEQLAVNIRAVILLTSKSMPLLKTAVQQGKAAQIINIASNAGKRGEATLASYSATKFAVVGFTESLHDELSTAGIKATAICPGLVDTPMADDYRDSVSPQEMIAPSDIAEAIRMTIRVSRSCVVPEIVLLRPIEWRQPEGA
ncbi:SDR family NAD(P)-dependent oxidoreductase [Mycobacterium sp. CVI_P3]|uniref:SDR family NAD(P)-dependent oxidoreductase n=1 Tax=Mycobacterium pinniadriaticum TaxID=2994102 RepID=A0ABT3S7I0_9MYCO|nr:SDR family oxidoreductase [Mycobacterium pinniadriaticum]MCX2928673.1 SDR family NAD(P)-dependent oxidoreductase [Mycobacterium pinniadriaticum]MCX2935460.1 SDR family NAD(P)-dependent oxidoreductase [Mycobacterium pinniadriaticum]